jgi:hypothetical protein
MAILAKEEFLKLSKADRLKAMKAGQFIAPKEGSPEREEFNKLMFKEPAEVPPPSSEPKPAPAPVTPPIEPKPGDTPPAPPAPPAEPPKDFGGYPTMEAFVEAHNKQKTLLQQQQSIIDKINATNGKQGRELKTLQEQLADVTKKIKEQKPVELPDVEVVIPARPNPSDPDKYPDGILDKKYQTDFDAYTAKLEEAARYGLTASKANRELSKKVDAFGRELEETKSFIQENKVQRVNSESQTAWDGLSQSLNEFQKENGIAMTFSWTEINSRLLVAKDETATKEARDAAAAWINALPQADIENYKKLTPVVTTFADFSTGLPKPRFQSMKSHAFRGSLEDQGLTFQPVPPAQRPPAPQPPASGVTPLSASETSSAEPKLSDLQTGNEKQNRLRELANMRAADPKTFNANVNLKKEFMDLRAYFGAPMRA